MFNETVSSHDGHKKHRNILPLICGKTPERASLTLEAAAVLPLFLFFCIALISFLSILELQSTLQSAMDETARSMGKTAYLLERAAGGDSPEEEYQNLLGQNETTLMTAGINPTTIKIRLLSCSGLRTKLEKSRVKSGAGGLYTFSSSYDPSEGILDLAVQYDYSVPWLPSSLGTLRFAQRMRTHAWVGSSLKNTGGNGDGSNGETVYVTPSGTVYHLSADCNYLDLSIRAASASELSSLRNKSGARYQRCEECASSESTMVYITDYGTHWHSSLSCSGLKRTVMEKDLSEVGDLHVCSKCQAEASHNHE